jgi:hypothetical protein
MLFYSHTVTLTIISVFVCVVCTHRKVLLKTYILNGWLEDASKEKKERKMVLNAIL